MSFMKPFQVQAHTSLIPISTTATVPIQPSTIGTQGMMLENLSPSVDVYIEIAAYGSTGNLAAVPTTGSSTGSFPLMARGTRFLTVPPNCWISAIAAASSGYLSCTPGDGIS